MTQRCNHLTTNKDDDDDDGDAKGAAAAAAAALPWSKILENIEQAEGLCRKARYGEAETIFRRSLEDVMQDQANQPAMLPPPPTFHHFVVQSRRYCIPGAVLYTNLLL